MAHWYLDVLGITQVGEVIVQHGHAIYELFEIIVVVFKKQGHFSIIGKVINIIERSGILDHIVIINQWVCSVCVDRWGEGESDVHIQNG